MTYTDRRNSTRIPVVKIANVVMPDNTSINYPVRELSMTGILLAGSTDFPLGIYCTVTLEEQLTTRSVTLSFAGQLVRKSQDVIAIQLIGTDTKTFDILQTIILYEITDPVSFCEELTDNFQMQFYQPLETMRNPLTHETQTSH